MTEPTTPSSGAADAILSFRIRTCDAEMLALWELAWLKPIGRGRFA
ncbi:MAG: hypothetical protein WCK35_13495 [Chloroflexota bacterium]